VLSLRISRYVNSSPFTNASTGARGSSLATAGFGLCSPFSGRIGGEPWSLFIPTRSCAGNANGSRRYWSGLSKKSRIVGRPTISLQIRKLIRTLSEANPLWRARRIHGELLKLGIEVSERTVSRVLRGIRRPPSQTWKTFLRNHLREIVAVDFLTVPTIRLRVLFVFLVLEHQRRRVIHFGVTEHPTAEWTAQQTAEAFSERDAKRYLIRDRDSIYGNAFRRRVDSLNMQEVVTAARSPWQNAFAERLIGSIRRECLDHVVVLNRRHLRCVLKSYFAYYHRSRTHLGLTKDAPDGRAVMPKGEIIAFPEVVGLHHRYERRAA